MTNPRSASNEKPVYSSAFGGLWPDRSDAEAAIDARTTAGWLTSIEAERLRHWVQHGWVSIEGAIDAELVDAYHSEIVELVRSPSDVVMVSSGRTLQTERLRPEHLAPENSARIVDHYVFSERARQILFAPAVQRFLRIVFEEAPLLFQSLGFEFGSQQGIHQDTAYVVVEPPMSLIGVWIALEDVVEGAGELTYYDGSHRLPEYRFGGLTKHWVVDRDGREAHEEWAKLMHENARKMSLAQVDFRPKKGDVLFWHADLAHGGRPIQKPGTTRRSLVGHFCPVSAMPHYFRFIGERAVKVPWRDVFYSSFYYDTRRG